MELVTSEAMREIDAECIENDGDYKRVIAAYAKVSRGAVSFTGIRDRVDWHSEVARVSFRANGKRFSAELPQPSDYVADGFGAFMNEVLEELGESRRFHELPTDDQIVSLVLVTSATYSRARRLALIP